MPGNRLFVAVEQTAEDRGVHFRWLPDGPAHVLPPSSPKAPVRFSVGEPGKRSSVWRLWGTKKTNDLYLASRASAGIFKYSFHASGDWRLQGLAHEAWRGPGSLVRPDRHPERPRTGSGRSVDACSQETSRC